MCPGLSLPPRTHNHLPEQPAGRRPQRAPPGLRLLPGAPAGPGTVSCQKPTTGAQSAAAGRPVDKRHHTTNTGPASPAQPSPAPPRPVGLVLTLTKSRKSRDAARPRAAALNCATCSKLVKRRGRRRTKCVHWLSAAPSWARRTTAAAAVSATSSHRAQAPGRAKRARPSLRQARTSAKEKYSANSSRLTCGGGAGSGCSGGGACPVFPLLGSGRGWG